MDARALLCGFTLATLGAWALWVDVLIDGLEMRQGIRGSFIVGVLFVALLSWASVSETPPLPFWLIALASLAGLSYRVIYFLRIRKNHHPYLSRNAHNESGAHR